VLLAGRSEEQKQELARKEREDRIKCDMERRKREGENAKRQRYLQNRLKYLWACSAAAVVVMIVAQTAFPAPVAIIGVFVIASALTKPDEKDFQLGVHVRETVQNELGGFLGGIVNYAAPHIANALQAHCTDFTNFGFCRLAAAGPTNERCYFVGMFYGWYSVRELVPVLVTCSAILIASMSPQGTPQGTRHRFYDYGTTSSYNDFVLFHNGIVMLNNVLVGLKNLGL